MSRAVIKLGLEVMPIRENLGGSIVAWVPRKASLADDALRRSSKNAHK